MSRVNVRCVECIREFRARFLLLGDSLSQAVSQGLSELGKTAEWLRGERSSYWKLELRRRRELLLRTKEEYCRAQARARDYHGTCLRERKAVDAAKEAVNEAEQRILNIRRWVVELERAGESILIPGRRLLGYLEGAIPAAAARLDAIAVNLERYSGLQESPRRGRQRPAAGEENAISRKELR